MELFTLVIGNKNYSSWSLRSWLMMKVLGIPFKEILIPLYQAHYKKDILKYSPAGKVPVLLHERTVIWDSLAIGEYLAETFPRKGFWPKQRNARTVARSVAAEMHSGFMALRTNCPMDVRASCPKGDWPAEVQADTQRIINIWEQCRKVFGKKGPFLFGAFSIADAMYAPVVWRFHTYGIKLSGASRKYQEMILNLPAMEEWKQASIAEPWVIPH